MVDVIIVGAGTAGLYVARELSRQKKNVVILESRSRVGGRIQTAQIDGFSRPVELGAEFIHGDLPLTTSILKEAGVKSWKGEGTVWNVYNGKLEQGDFFTNDWDDMLNKLKQLDHDMSIAAFLRLHFSDAKYDDLRENVVDFVSGYDAADPEKASALSLKEEWLAEEDITGYHPEGGYSRMVDFLLQECIANKVEVKLAHEVTAILWERGKVAVQVKGVRTFHASKVIVTIPPAVLKKQPAMFSPAITSHLNAVQKIETGGVIKFLVEFYEPFWEEKGMKDLHFIFSDADIPTWWTQNPKKIPLLTGWLAGPILDSIDHSTEALQDRCHHSLQYIFSITEEEVRSKIRAMKIMDWTADEFAYGAYAYRSVEGTGALKILATPIDDTIYFAGEAYSDGSDMGTVEAALRSAEKIVASITR